jgi:hypothetical protein
MEVDRVGCEGGSEKMFKELGRLAGPKTCHLYWLYIGILFSSYKH